MIKNGYGEYLERQNNIQSNDDIEMAPNTNLYENMNMCLEPPDIKNQQNLTVPNPSVGQFPFQNEGNQSNLAQANNDNEVINPDEYEPNVHKDLNGDDEKLNFYPELPKVESNKTNTSYQYTENHDYEFSESETENNFPYFFYEDATKDNSKEKK